jgi:serine/threonine protein kinase
MWGTPYYVASEKLRGHSEDLRSDIYSLGATLFHALAGRPPFEADTADEMAAKHRTQPALSLPAYEPNLHERTTKAVACMLAQDPAERYKSYEEVIQDLTEAQEELKSDGAVKTIGAPTGKQLSILSLMGILAILAICVAAGWFIWKNRLVAFH